MSKKTDALLKKATFFERMALYSDRKAFLQSLAAGASDTWPAARGLPRDIAEGINSVMKDLYATKPNSTALQNQLQSFYEGTNKDMGQLAQALSEAANTIPGDHTGQVQHALELADKVRQLVAQPPQESETEQTMTFSPDPQRDRVVGFAPIPRDVQEMLGRILTVEGFGIPIGVDGQIGKETRKALNAFRQRFNVAGNFKDSDVFEVIKNTYNRNPARYGQLTSK